MNKAELVQALAERLDGDRKVAATAVDGLLDVIVRTVHSGDAVSVTGFGVFERRERAARSARNPRTGQLIEIAATAVPAFRPGAMFRDVVSGARPLEASAPRSPRMDRPRSTADAAGAVSGVVNGAVAPVPEAAVEVPAVTATESKPVKAAKAVKASKPSKAPKSTKPEPKSVKASKNADKDKGKKKGRK